MADDGMSAAVDVAPGEAADAEQLAAALQRAGVVLGVDDEACARVGEALQDPAWCVEGLVVAMGVAPVAGRDGFLAPSFDPGIQPGHVDDDGRMDMRDRDLLKPVRAGAHLGLLHLPAPSQPGKRVDGAPCPVASAREASLTLGPGVARSDAGEVRALVDGVILYVPNEQLDVVREYAHRGDVDFRCGNLDMVGSLRISGDVTRSFRVRASGDVEVLGSVLDATVVAGGSLSVRGTVQGGSEGGLSARGNVRLRSAERATIQTRGLLKLDAGVHCQLVATEIEAGVLRGGRARAERSLIARELGTESGSDTSILAGQPLELELDDVRTALTDAKNQRWKQRARAVDAASSRARGGKGGRMRPPLQLEQLLALRREREQLSKTACVVVQAIAHPGVTIQLGDALLSLTEPVRCSRFTYDAQSRSIRSERYVP